MSAPVIWILASASAFLLITGGFTLAVARFRARVLARRRQAAKLGAQLEGKSADPFGELQIIADQLRKIQQRLAGSEQVAGLPVQGTPDGVAPGGAAVSGHGGAPVTSELEQDLDLFKKEVYDKSQRIDLLQTEKQLLADKIVELEQSLATYAASAPASRGTPTGASLELVDVLQNEADELRAQIAERDKLFSNLQKQDTSGLMKEVGRIRAELLERNNEVGALKLRLADAGQSHALQARLDALEQEKDGLAAKALAATTQLRQANERMAHLEQRLASRRSAAKAPPAPTPPPVPRAQPSGPPRVPPTPATARPAPPRPPSPGFPDEPTIKDPPQRLTPPPQPKGQPKARTKRRPTGSIFPPPPSKKDLLD